LSRLQARQHASREGWKLHVLDMDVTNDASGHQ
jgi:hypothetical protein